VEQRESSTPAGPSTGWWGLGNGVLAHFAPKWQKMCHFARIGVTDSFSCEVAPVYFLLSHPKSVVQLHFVVRSGGFNFSEFGAKSAALCGGKARILNTTRTGWGEWRPLLRREVGVR